MGYVCSSTHPACGTEYAPLLMDDELIKNDIRQTKREGADRVVLCLHWGQEEVSLPTPQDRLRAREYAEAGADLIIGHHSHCIQAWEVVGECPVFYGLGNLIMPALRVPTEFDETGSPQSWHVRKQYFWNRKSMMVVWNPTNGQWTTRFTDYRRCVLTGLADGSADRLQITQPCDDEYVKHYRQTVRRSLLRTALANYVSRPRLPNRSHFRALLGMLGRTTRDGEGNRE